MRPLLYAMASSENVSLVVALAISTKPHGTDLVEFFARRAGEWTAIYECAAAHWLIAQARSFNAACGTYLKGRIGQPANFYGNTSISNLSIDLSQGCRINASGNTHDHRISARVDRSLHQTV